MPDSILRQRSDSVAPRSGAWIEIFNACASVYRLSVAPRSGAWIEIIKDVNSSTPASVAPRSGAWIEMLLSHQ